MLCPIVPMVQPLRSVAFAFVSLGGVVALYLVRVEEASPALRR